MDNALVESFFSNLKCEKIKKKINKTLKEIMCEVFESNKGVIVPWYHVSAVKLYWITGLRTIITSSGRMSP